jgi:hypothetical protein
VVVGAGIGRVIQFERSEQGECARADGVVAPAVAGGDNPTADHEPNVPVRAQIVPYALELVGDPPLSGDLDLEIRQGCVLCFTGIRLDTLCHV